MTNHDTAPDMGRYAKQILFRGIGVAGQERILRSRIAIVGVGALGTVIATQLARAGVGYLRLIDRDFVELGNLHRQVLFDEDDAVERLPKAIAAVRHLRAANHTIEYDPRVDDVTPHNVEELIGDVDVVLDGTDNLETRFLVNDACIKLGIPWVYGGALGSNGTTMTVVPGVTACLRCLMPQAPPPGALLSCDTEGVLAPTTGIVGSFEAAEALRLLTGESARSSVVYFDVWERDLITLQIERRPDCPACGLHRFDYLSGERTTFTTVLCGRNSVQITPPEDAHIVLPRLAERLAGASGTSGVQFNGFLLTITVDSREIVLFPTGRAIIKGTTDEAEARTLYARYVGA